MKKHYGWNIFVLIVMFVLGVAWDAGAAGKAAKHPKEQVIYAYGGDSATVWYDENDGCVETYIYLSFSIQKSAPGTVAVFAVRNQYNYCGGIGTGMEGFEEVPLSSFEKLSIEQKKSRIKGEFFIKESYIEVDLDWSPAYGGSSCKSHDRYVGPSGTYTYKSSSSSTNSEVNGTIGTGLNEFVLDEESAGGSVSHDKGKTSIVTKKK